jgi:hypothetical protein
MWFFAQDHCRKLTVGGRFGWRLPTIEELASLLDPNATSTPLLPAGHPFIGVQVNLYWSATTSASSGVLDDALGVDFSGGKFVTDVGPKRTQNNFVWCVRGGQGVNPQ